MFLAVQITNMKITVFWHVKPYGQGNLLLLSPRSVDDPPKCLLASTNPLGDSALVAPVSKPHNQNNPPIQHTAY